MRLFRFTIFALATLLPTAMMAASQSQLVFSASLVRHGARTMAHYGHSAQQFKLPTAWNESNIPARQLTQYGFQEGFETGLYFRQADASLFAQSPATEKTVCMLSDGTNRDIMTGEAVLTGFFPSKIPFRIHTIPHEHDPLLQPDNAQWGVVSTLPGWKYLWHSRYGYPLFQQLLKQGVITKSCGYTVASGDYFACLKPIIDLSGDLSAVMNYCQHSDSACRLDDVMGIQPNQVALIKRSALLFYQHQLFWQNEPGFSTDMATYQKLDEAIGAKVFITEVIHDMDQVIHHQTPLKLVLYMGHNTTIMAALSYLYNRDPALFHYQLPMKQAIAYAASLSFQLYRDAQGGYQFSVLFRNGSGPKTPVQRLYDGSFEVFKEKYFVPSVLKKLDGTKRCIQ